MLLHLLCGLVWITLLSFRTGIPLSSSRLSLLHYMARHGHVLCLRCRGQPLLFPVDAPNGKLVAATDVTQVYNVLLPLYATFSQDRKHAAVCFAAVLVISHVTIAIIWIWKVKQAHYEAIWALPAACHLTSALLILALGLWASGVPRRIIFVHGLGNVVTFVGSAILLVLYLVGKVHDHYEGQCSLCLVPSACKMLLRKTDMPEENQAHRLPDDLSYFNP